MNNAVHFYFSTTIVPMLSDNASTEKYSLFKTTEKPPFLYLFLVNIIVAVCVFTISYNIEFTEGYDRVTYETAFEESVANPVDFLNYYVQPEKKEAAYYALMYVASSVGITVNYFIALLNAVTVFLILQAFNSLNVTRYHWWLFFILVISTLNVSLFSGVRFFFALAFYSFFVTFFYRGKHFIAFLYLLLASVMHVSFAVFFALFFPIFRKSLFNLYAALTLFTLGPLFQKLNVYEWIDRFASSFGYFSVSRAITEYSERQGVFERNVLFYILFFWILVPIAFQTFRLRTQVLAAVLSLNLTVMSAFVNNFQIFARYTLPLMVCFVFVLGVNQERKDYVVFLILLGLYSTITFVLDKHDNIEVYENLGLRLLSFL